MKDTPLICALAWPLIPDCCLLQDVEGENYLGIQLLRFYFRCAACSAEFILKTDPANTDYTMEKGATRNYEPWREKERDVAQAVADREEEERGNAMKVRCSLRLSLSQLYEVADHNHKYSQDQQSA